MDATLRGRYVKYCDYFQVGKGRDMGVDTVLGFFAKLSSGCVLGGEMWVSSGLVVLTRGLVRFATE